MNFVTRCPGCSTAFRVQTAQLSQRSGKVRCGKCNMVFDALSHLVAETTAAAAPEPSPQLGLFEAGHPRTRPLDPRNSLYPTPGGAPGDGAAQEDIEPEFLVEREPRRMYYAVWSLLSLLALAALAAQVVMHFRTEILVLAPQSRPWLVAACEILQCEVRLPRRTELMSIDSSDLQAETNRDNVIALNAVIRNRAPFAQEHPWLELTLTDQGDQPVVRRVLRPSDYLDPARGQELAAQGVAAGNEVILRLFFDTSRVRATGYRLYLFYP